MKSFKAAGGAAHGNTHSNPSPAKRGGMPQRPSKSVVRSVGTKPLSNHMGGGSGPYNEVNLSSFANRRIGHKKG